MCYHYATDFNKFINLCFYSIVNISTKQLNCLTLFYLSKTSLNKYIHYNSINFKYL